jgi:hypothetical protein
MSPQILPAYSSFSDLLVGLEDQFVFLPSGLVVNDLVSAYTDGSFCIILTDVVGFDSPKRRVTNTDNPDRHGETPGKMLFAGRDITMDGYVDAPNMPTKNVGVRTLLNAIQSTEQWQMIVRSADNSQVFRKPEVALTVRLEGDVQMSRRIDGSHPYRQTFQFTLHATDPRMLSTTVHNVLASPSEIGRLATTSPWRSPLTASTPIDSSYTPIGSNTLVDPNLTGNAFVARNLGASDSYPVYQLTGPMTLPRIINQTTGAVLRTSRSLAIAEKLIIDTWRGTAESDVGANRYNYISDDSDWPALPPGVNNLSLVTDGYGPGAQASVSWADTWLG